MAWYLDRGLHFVGLLPGRPHDVTGVGIACSRFSNSKRRFTDATNQNRALIGELPFPIDDYESVREITRRIEIKPWWYLQSDLQYVIHPGGSSMVADARVLGVSSTLSF